MIIPLQLYCYLLVTILQHPHQHQHTKSRPKNDVNGLMMIIHLGVVQLHLMVVAVAAVAVVIHIHHQIAVVAEEVAVTKNSLEIYEYARELLKRNQVISHSFYRQVAIKVVRYMKSHNIPITSIYRDFDINSISKCDDVWTIVEPCKGYYNKLFEYSSTNHIACLPGLGLTAHEMRQNESKGKLRFNWHSVKNYILWEYIISSLLFWRK